MRHVLILVLLGAGCGENASSGPDYSAFVDAASGIDSVPRDATQGGDDLAQGDASQGGGDASSDTQLYDSGPTHLASCQSFNSSCKGFKDPNCGKCEYRVRFNKKHCSKTKPCDNLFMLWTAGTCGDTIVKGLDKILNGNTDFITACVAPQVPGQMLPVSLGAPEREKTLIPHVLNRLRENNQLGVWSGKNLLMGGCSAGGSRYPVVAARYPDEAAWVGSAKTGACFGDGVVSISYQDNFTGSKIGVGKSCAARHGRVIIAYTGVTPTPKHACGGSPKKQCPCDPDHTHKVYAGDCADGDCVDFDSIIVQKKTGAELVFNKGVTASSFAVPHWKLITEGSSWESSSERCENDIAPRGPYKALCAAIDADPGHSCTFVEKPNQNHCAYYFNNLDTACVSWFRTL